jgi:hypothetical protein
MRSIPLLIVLLLATCAAPAAAATSWSDAGELAMARVGATATLLDDGTVLVAGGSGSTTAERFDPATGTWSATGSLSVPREGHTATLLPDGDVLVTGGYIGGARAEAERYDPATGTWTPAASMLTPRARHIAMLIPGGKVLVAGGSDGSAELYDPVANVWTPTSAMSVTRWAATATLLGDGDVLVAGGSTGAGIASSAERYDAATGAWTLTGDMIQRRAVAAAARLADGSVLLAGGDAGATILASAEIYDPVSNTWSPAAPMRQPRMGTLTALADGRVLATGSTPTAELFDPATRRWSAVDAPAVARSVHTATLLSDGTVLVAGGGGILAAERYRHASTFSVTGAYFGDRTVGSDGAPAALVVRNTGLQRLIVTGVTPAGATDFAVTADECTGKTVAPGDACRVGVAFRPAAAGERRAQLRVMSDTGDAEVAELAGTGLAAPATKPPAVASASCTRHSARAARCRFFLPGVSGWGDAKVTLKRGKRTLAAGRVLAWKGRGSLKLRGARKLRGGAYSLVLKLRGRPPVTLPVALR